MSIAKIILTLLFLGAQFATKAQATDDSTYFIVVELLKDYQDKALTILPVDSAIAPWFFEPLEEGFNGKYCEPPDDQRLYLAQHGGATIKRDSLTARFKRERVKVKKLNEGVGFSDSIYILKIIELWYDKEICWKFQKYPEHGYCNLEFQVLGYLKNELKGIRATDEIYCYVEKKDVD